MRHPSCISTLGLAAALGMLCLSHASADRARTESSFVLMHDANTTTMSGSIGDLERVRQAQKGSELLLWYRTAAGEEYLVRDEATIAKIRVAWRPVRGLGEQQSKLGEKQSALGEQQSKLGEKQAAIEVMVDPLERELDALSERREHTSSPAERDSIARRRHALKQQIRELQARARELDRQMRVFDPPMRELDRQMEVLDRKADAAEKVAHAELDAIVARAIASGAAKPFR